jgi:hypothetical protein
MPVRLPDRRASVRTAGGRAAGSPILLGAPAAVGEEPHQVLADRINPRTLAVDFRHDVDEDLNAECQVERFWRN